MMQRELLTRWATDAGFARVGVTPALPLEEFAAFSDWSQRGLAGPMTYLTDRRAAVRGNPRHLLSTARSLLCVAYSYTGPSAASPDFDDAGRAWISCYAWGDDYHDIVKKGLEQVATRMANAWGAHDWRACVDTAPLLERGYARLAGLGWIGRNQCLIDERSGSWFFLGFLLTSHELLPDSPPPDRCGTCRRCIDACPTAALVPNPAAPGGWELDARLCISTLTIETRGSIPEPLRAAMGRHIFGCDICQEVCPWDRRLLRLPEPARATAPPRDGIVSPPLDRLAALTPQEIQALFRGTPVTRARYHGFLRNVAVAMGNSGVPSFRKSLEPLARHENAMVAEHAQWALERLAG